MKSSVWNIGGVWLWMKRICALPDIKIAEIGGSVTSFANSRYRKILANILNWWFSIRRWKLPLSTYFKPGVQICFVSFQEWIWSIWPLWWPKMAEVLALPPLPGKMIPHPQSTSNMVCAYVCIPPKLPHWIQITGLRYSLEMSLSIYLIRK